MKNIKNKLLISVLGMSLIAGTTSCGDGFLEENSAHKTTSALLDTEEGILAMAAGLYGNIRWHFGYEWAYGITLYGTDEFTNGADLTSEPWNTYDLRLNPLDCTMENGAANKNCPGVSALWDEMYYGISTANLVISKAEGITAGDTRDKAMGEAYFLRGYNFYRLFAQYGGIVLQTKPADASTRTFTRATEEETLNQIIADFEEAYKLLPIKKWRGNGTWTKYTAAHFLAKVLLYRQSERCSDWNSKYTAKTDLDKAISLCDEVIAACPLAEDYNQLYSEWTGVDCPNEGLSEILMTAEHNEATASSIKGRFGNRTYNYFNPQFSNFSNGWVKRGQFIGGMDFQRCRPTEYAYSVFDNVNDARMWKTFKTIYGLDNVADKAENVASTNGIDVSQVPNIGDEGIIFILNKRNDPRFADETTYGTFGRGAVKHTFIHPETGKWVPNVFPLFLGGQYVLNTYGVSGNPSQSNVFCGINKTDDGSRTEEKGDAHRDVIMARTGETYLIKAEAQVRNEDYSGAIATVNKLRERAEWKAGEDREYYTDGSMAFDKNATASVNSSCKDANGKTLTNAQAHEAAFIQRNTYYLSTGIDRTTDPSSLQIASYTNLPAEDEAILAEIGCSSVKERMINFILNERTRECLGEWNRWEELSRTGTLIKRAKLFNPEASAITENKHELRPIPQKFIDTLQDENGNNLSDAEKDKWQNPGY